MSMTVRISDEVGEEIRMIKPEDMSFSKAAETILRLAVKALYSSENESNDSTSSGSDNDSFSEKLKKISESLFSKLEDDDTDDEIISEKNAQEDLEESENKNSKMRIQELKNEILNLKKSEEHFSKIENELSEISKIILENQKEVIEKIKSKHEDFSEKKIDYTTLVSAKKEQIYLMTCKKEQYPFILPDDKKPWCYMKWHISDEHNTATLEYNYNPLAVADVAHQKIMIITPLEQQVWYEQEGDMQTLMYICERKLMRAFSGKLPLWFQKGIQFTYDEGYKQNLYNKQAEINEERRKRGLYEFESFRY